MSAPLDLNALPLPDLYRELSRGGLVRRLLELARDEDLGSGEQRGDITSESWSAAEARGRYVIAARQAGVLAGLAAAPDLIELFSPESVLHPRAADGDRVEAGAVIAEIEGPAAAVPGLERTMLNLLGRLSGVATLTARFVETAGTAARARVFDTRKTTPGLRVLEKYAVRCGGGFCHRLGLYDAVLVKDNHIAGVPPERLTELAAQAARRARGARPLRFVEFEADGPEQVSALLAVERGLIDVILLDNMSPALLREMVLLRDWMNPGVLLEASGGVRLETIRAIAESGVERISCGAVTHSAVSIDFGLDATG